MAFRHILLPYHTRRYKRILLLQWEVLVEEKNEIQKLIYQLRMSRRNVEQGGKHLTVFSSQIRVENCPGLQ